MEPEFSSPLPSPAPSTPIATPRSIVVWVLVPIVESADPNLACYNDYSQSHDEYERAFLALGHQWRWQPVSMADFRAVIDVIVASAGDAMPVVFNLCDGDEVNGVPGLSVVRYLSDQGLCFTGADLNFYADTTSKITMKQIFADQGVPTAPWAIVDETTPLAEYFGRCGSPIIVKPAVSAGSMGITVDSVVQTEDALRAQLALLNDGYRGWDLAGGGVIVEQFIAGREFTTFIVGSHDAPEVCIVYPPIERVFHESLPPTEQLLSFDRLWEIYERETPLENDAYLWEYAPAPSALADRIVAVSRVAYAAVGGRGYGRVDLRMDAATGTLYVLEVNAQCGISEDENYTSIGAILRFANVAFSDAVQCIIADAQRSLGLRTETPGRTVAS